MTMDFKGAGARVRSLIAAKKPQELSPSALTTDKLRDNLIDEAIDSSPRYQAVADQQPTVQFEREQEDGTKIQDSFAWRNFSDALRDVARGAFSYEEPQLRKREEIRPSHRFNREVVAGVLNSPEFMDSRPYTRDNAPESLWGAQSLTQKMVEAAPDAAEHIARAEQMADAEQQIGDAEDILAELREQAREQHDEIFGVDPDLTRQIKDQVARREQARGQLGQLVDEHQASNANTVARKLGRSAAKGYADAVETMAAMSNLPGLEPGTPHNLTPAQQFDLAEKMMRLKGLLEIARELGRMVPDMRFKRQARSRDVAVEPVGITTGRDIGRLLPFEFGRMQIDALKPLWALDWANGSLLEWEMGGKEPAGKGPAIFVKDGSGSMDERRRLLASATELATLVMMQREKRDFAGIQFGSPGQMKSWFFAGERAPDPEQVMDMATHFFGGGTSILTGLQEAKRIIEDVPAFKTADVVILSDGGDNFAPADADIIREFETMGVRIHGISVLAPGNRYLEQACEYTVDVQDLAAWGDVTDALADNLT